MRGVSSTSIAIDEFHWKGVEGLVVNSVYTHCLWNSRMVCTASTTIFPCF